jgi:CheY-like chemotaxis protein
MDDERPKKILIIDDSPSHRLLLKTYLKGFEIVESENGIEALKVLEGTEVDLIICDFEMPGMNGPDFATEIQKHKVYEKIPFIMCSANPVEEKYLNQFKGTKFVTQWIEKSIKVNELKRIVYGILDDE